MSSAITKDLFAFAEDNRPSIVYIATNVKNGKFYIGVTRKTVEKRKSQHANYAAHCGKSHFHKAINKHGIDAFKREMTPAMVAGARRRRKAVICLDDGKVYESSKEASQAYGIKRFRDVNAVCSGKAKSACGRRFSYLIGSTQ